MKAGRVAKLAYVEVVATCRYPLPVARIPTITTAPPKAARVPKIRAASAKEGVTMVVAT